MMKTFTVPPPNPWINPDGSPTLTFFNFITSLFTSAGGGGASNDTILANIAGVVAPPVANTLTAILDAIVGNAEGNILVRGPTIWAALALGPNKQALLSNGTTVAYGTVVNSIGGGSGVSFSGTSGAVSITLSNAVILAAGVPASITSIGGDLQVAGATNTVILGAPGGVAKFGQPAKAAAVAGNFSANRFITIADASGTVFFIPADTAPW